MKKDIKDYLHLYLGCECMIGDLNWKPETNLYGLAPGVDPNHGRPIRTKLDAHVLNVFSHKTTLILRPLSSMTEDDGLKIFGSKTKYLLYRKEAKELGADLWLFTANEYTELLKAGFDCHDLIPNNLAINAETLK